MSELINYISRTLDSKYDFVKTLSKTAVNELTLYKQKDSNNKIILIKSNNRNDDVFRRLRGLNCGEYLPAIFEVSSEEDYLYVLEEYIEGQSLFDMLQNSSSIDNTKIKQYLIDLCNSLEILHANSIVHRDIKPENVIIRNGHACLIDFSIAKITNAQSNDTRSLGTVGYAAPEQFGISQSQPATDIYALGVLANQLAIGTHPTIDVPKGKLGKIINKCTATQISKRYQNVVELKKELSKI